jgi:hypothetical protein
MALAQLPVEVVGDLDAEIVMRIELRRRGWCSMPSRPRRERRVLGRVRSVHRRARIDPAIARGRLASGDPPGRAGTRRRADRKDHPRRALRSHPMGPAEGPRVIIRRRFGYHSPWAASALAMLTLGGRCPLSPDGDTAHGSWRRIGISPPASPSRMSRRSPNPRPAVAGPPDAHQHAGHQMQDVGLRRQVPHHRNWPQPPGRRTTL